MYPRALRPSFRHGAFEKPGARRVRPRASLKLARGHLGVVAVVPETACLPVARRGHPRGDGGRWLTAGRAAEVAIADRRRRDVEIDAIEKRSGEPRVVLRELVRRAATTAERVALESARTSPRCLFAM